MYLVTFGGSLPRRAFRTREGVIEAVQQKAIQWLRTGGGALSLNVSWEPLKLKEDKAYALWIGGDQHWFASQAEAEEYLADCIEAALRKEDELTISFLLQPITVE